MAIVTFASPTLHRDVTVYATAGDTKTILSLAEKNEVKIPHDCREGDCGSCLIEVKYTRFT
jgi:ferredoxin